MTVELRSVFNPDFPRNEQTLVRPILAPVSSLKEASDVCRAFVDSSGIGGGNWGCGAGDVRDDSGKLVAQVSYNGRVWQPSKNIYNRKEIVL